MCGSSSGGWSSEFSFVSNSITADAFTIAVYGDMGISNSEATNARLIEQLNNYNFVMHVGDFGKCSSVWLLASDAMIAIDTNSSSCVLWILRVMYDI